MRTDRRTLLVKRELTKRTVAGKAARGAVATACAADCGHLAAHSSSLMVRREPRTAPDANSPTYEAASLEPRTGRAAHSKRRAGWTIIQGSHDSRVGQSNRFGRRVAGGAWFEARRR